MTETKLIQALWPLPGGNGRYLATLDQIMNWAATAQMPNRETFETWFMSQFSVGKGTINGYLQVVTAMGMLVQQADGMLVVSAMGKQFLQSDDVEKARLVAERFMCDYLAFPEVLAVYAEANEPIHVKTVVATLQPHFPRWTSSAQYEYRALWLLSLGCLRQEKGRVYEITDFGREIAHRFPAPMPIVGASAGRDGELASIQENGSVASGEDVRPPTPPEEDLKSPTPHLPLQSQAQSFLRILDGVPYNRYRDMYNEIWSQRGNPQEQVNWLDPEVWIPERLTGTERDLAWRIWRESKKNLNPRYIRGCWYFATKHDLLARNPADVLAVTDRGRRFLEESAQGISIQIDNDEGILEILRTVAEKGPGRRSEFLDEYRDYCHQQTTIQSLNVIKSYLYYRLQNLIDRGFIVRRGQSYEVTDEGLTYLEKVGHLLPDVLPTAKPQLDIRKLAKEMRDKAREQLSEYLATMDPFKFEELIKLLLEEMGYEEVTVTSATNDKGVDVVAHIELGISSVREVIQAKRHRGSINRTVLDQLRGSLHRFEAVRGTIITTGRFSSGVQQAAFERGAAPITLIDGQKLLDLLMDHQIGVVKRSVEYYDFDGTKLQQFEIESVTDAL